MRRPELAPVTPPPPRHSQYRPDVDGLRGIAVLAVVVYHAFPRLLHGGFVGVDIFFVISGYLISTIILQGLEQGRFTFREFYTRRIKRIFPALIVVLGAVFLLGYLLLFVWEYRNLGQQIVGGAFFVSNFTLWRDTGYFSTAAELKPLLHLWSLGIEEQFYILWPFLLYFAARRRWNTLRLFAAVFAISFVLNVALVGRMPVATFYLAPTRLWELVAGGILAHLTMANGQASGAAGQGMAGPMHELLSIAGLMLIAAGIVGLDGGGGYPGWRALLPTTGAFLVIAAGPQAWINRRVLSARWLVAAGLISYPLYLWHWPLLSFARTIEGTPSTGVILALVGTAVLLSWLTFRFVEKPIRYGTSQRRDVAPALLGVLLVVGVGGIGVQLGAIRPRLRTPPAIQAAIGDWDYPGGNQPTVGSFRVATLPGTTDEVLFVGDSHMEQYWGRARDVSTAHPGAVLTAVFATYGGCPPLPGVNRVEDGHRCPQWFDWAMQLASNQRVKTVVFGARWEVYFLGAYGEPIGAPRLINASGRQFASGLAESGRLFSELGSVIRSLTQAGKKVVIILSNPTGPAFDPLSMAPDRIPFETNRSRPAGYVDRLSFEQFEKPVIDELKSVALNAGAETIDPLDYLCDAGVCPTMTADGRPIYSDRDHLRPFYARSKAVFIDHLMFSEPTAKPLDDQLPNRDR